MTGIEPAASRSQSERYTKLSYIRGLYCMGQRETPLDPKIPGGIYRAQQAPLDRLIQVKFEAICGVHVSHGSG